MQSVILKTVRNIETGEEKKLSSSKAKELLRTGSWIRVEDVGSGLDYSIRHDKSGAWLTLAMMTLLMAFAGIALIVWR